MTEIEQRNLVLRYMAAYNRFDVPGMSSLLTGDVRFENVSDGKMTASTSGVDEFCRLAAGAREVYAEREQRVSYIAFHTGVAVATVATRWVHAAVRSDGGSPASVLE